MAAFAGVDPAATNRRPVVALALHQQYIAAMQTAFIDDLIARIEAGGAVALPFYSPMLEAGALEQMLKPSGTRLADVLINTQIMLNAEERRAEFERLGIPVLQAMPYRRGDEAAWAANPQGVALMDVPFYLAQAEYAGVTDIQVAAATRTSDEQIVPIAAAGRRRGGQGAQPGAPATSTTPTSACPSSSGTTHRARRTCPASF